MTTRAQRTPAGLVACLSAAPNASKRRAIPRTQAEALKDSQELLCMSRRENEETYLLKSQAQKIVRMLWDSSKTIQGWSLTFALEEDGTGEEAHELCAGDWLIQYSVFVTNEEHMRCEATDENKTLCWVLEVTEMRVTGRDNNQQCLVDGVLWRTWRDLRPRMAKFYTHHDLEKLDTMFGKLFVVRSNEKMIINSRDIQGLCVIRNFNPRQTCQEWVPGRAYYTQPQLKIADDEAIIRFEGIEKDNIPEDLYNPDTDAQVYCLDCGEWSYVDKDNFHLDAGSKAYEGFDDTEIGRFMSRPIIRGKGWMDLLEDECGGYKTQVWMRVGTLGLRKLIEEKYGSSGPWPKLRLKDAPLFRGVSSQQNLNVNMYALRNFLDKLESAYECECSGDLP